MKAKPRVHVLFIPRWRPARKNSLINCHWRTKHRLKKYDREIVAVYAKALGMEKADKKRRLDVEIIMKPGSKVCDEDAFDLSLRDACVLCQLLVDDSPQWLTPGNVTQRKPDAGEEWGTRLWFTEKGA